MRVKHRLEVKDIPLVKKKLLHWARQFNQVVWLDSNMYPEGDITYEAILAVDAADSFQSNSPKSLEALKEYRKANKDWLFGYLSFDVEASLNLNKETGKSQLEFPNLYFFHPRKLFLITKDGLEISYTSDKAEEIDTDWLAIDAIEPPDTSQESLNIELHARLSKQEYLEKVRQVQAHIAKGEITELNFCQEFYAHTKLKDPLSSFQYLNEISSTPFSAYLRVDNNYALCASPERYLRNTARKIKSQPIKGTARRNQDTKEDAKIKWNLQHDEKELTENRIVVEMVEQEMHSVAESGSVEVTELCKLYTFKQVHQLISTVVCTLKSDLDVVDAIKATYPMGSMTGIPKANSLKLIESLENFERGLYSGSIGYFAPNGDFDFNVVIRSILYNDKNQYLSFAAGGAITELSSPENEYEETRVKTKAMEQILGKIKY